jgi:hypothetical protein
MSSRVSARMPAELSLNQREPRNLAVRPSETCGTIRMSAGPSGRFGTRANRVIESVWFPSPHLLRACQERPTAVACGWHARFHNRNGARTVSSAASSR